MSTPDDEYRALLEDREGIITALRARIAELEARLAKVNSIIEKALGKPVCEIESMLAALLGEGE